MKPVCIPECSIYMVINIHIKSKTVIQIIEIPCNRRKESTILLNNVFFFLYAQICSSMTILFLVTRGARSVQRTSRSHLGTKQFSENRYI